MNEHELKEAKNRITLLNARDCIGELDKQAMRVLIDFAQSYLEASKELPEQRDSCIKHKVFREDCLECMENYGFNSCLDQVTSIVARLWDENEELKQQICDLKCELETRVSLSTMNNVVFEKQQLQSSLTASEQRVKELEQKNEDLKHFNNDIISHAQDLEAKIAELSAQGGSGVTIETYIQQRRKILFNWFEHFDITSDEYYLRKSELDKIHALLNGGKD